MRPAIATALLWVFGLGLTDGTIVGAEFQGLVSEVSGTTIKITSPFEELPQPGDDVAVFVTLTDGDGISVIATGRVTSVDNGTISAEIIKATGVVKASQFARIRTGSGAAAAVPSKSRPKIPEGLPIPPTDLPEPESENPGKSGPSAPEGDRGSAASGAQQPPANGAPPGNFSEVVERSRQGVFLAGNPARGTTGTAFVISRSLRVLATSARVADVTDRVVLNQGRTVYRVVKKWYHPGLIRRMDDGRTTVHSADPADGEVDVASPDLALLQLEASGPNLPAELPLAGIEDVLQIQASAFGVLGFPGQKDQGVANSDLLASASFLKGNVSRTTGYNGEAGATPARQQLVHLSVPLLPGFSGSPVILSDGRVAAVANPRAGGAGQLGSGVRTDALWELIRFADLQGRIPGAPERIQIVTPPQPDPRVEALRRAMRLVDEAADFRHHHEFEEATEHLEEAIELLPDYWKAYWMRGVSIDHSIKHGKSLPTEARLKLHRAAMADHVKADGLYRGGFGRPNVRIVLDAAREQINIGRLANDASSFQSAVALLDDPSVLGSVGTQRGYLLALRGSVKMDLKDLPGALKDLSAAISADPESADFYTARALVLQQLGQGGLAAADSRKAEELHAKEHSEHQHIPGLKPGHHDHKHP